MSHSASFHSNEWIAPSNHGIKHLGRRRAGRYGHAARHLSDCAAADAEIRDYGPHLSHADYLDGLRQSHARKSAFWERLRTG
ncbi:DUF6880 family protein [Rhodovulum sulfidophilum]|uniref:DUF6880 family protein n=1 Tax=Rhodovulum sulfidophilum TaxID=35806 RepID=UPI002DD42945|nr:DUF6880 family protein [Rhodovulum sulfidophilum]